MLISDVLALNARKCPDRLALVAGERQFTFAELGERVRRLANALRGTARHGDRVAILAENCAEYVDAYYGVPAAGMALAILNYRLNPTEIAALVSHAEASVILIQEKYLKRMLAVKNEMPSLTTWVVIGGGGAEGLLRYDAFLETGSADIPGPEVDDRELAWLIYTSGTTGLPKGVMLSHKNLAAGIVNSVIAWRFSTPGRSATSLDT